MSEDTKSGNNGQVLQEVERLRHVIRIANAGYWDLNLVDNSLYLSPIFYTMLGYEVDEFPATFEAWNDLLHPDDQERAASGTQEFLESSDNHYDVEIRMRRKDGEYIWVHDSGEVVERDDDGKTVRVIGIIRDITERKASFDDLIVLESALETATTGVVIYGLDGRVERANAACYEMLGADIESQELAGANMDSVLTDESRQFVSDEIMPAIMGGESWRGDLQLVTADEEIIDVDASFAPVLDDLGSVVAISGIVTDVTEQREIEAVMQEQNQAMMEMSTPVITLWDEIVMLPLVGTIDDDRAMQMTERLLEAIVGYEARVAILDVTGVAVIDTSVARNLLKAVDAASMLGAKVVVTGFSPSAAQTLAQLGVDFASLMTQGSLRAGIAQAFGLVGQRVAEAAARN